MQVRFSNALPEDGVIALALAAGDELVARVAQAAGAAPSLAARAIRAQRFEAKPGELLELLVPAGEGVTRLFVAGVGEGGESEYEKAGAALVARLSTSGETLLGARLAGASAEAVARFAFGAVLRGWRHDAYRTKLPEKERRSLAELVIAGAPAGVEAAWSRHKAVAEGVIFTRELVTEPANIIYPESFVARCRELEALGVEIEVLDEPAMKALGMGALLGVAQGSARPPRLLAMRWKGADVEPVAFVGKGVTFDTGGISIKPAAGMEDMKWDMGGAAAVAGAMKALAGRKAKAHVIGVCGLVENMPSGTAQRPGDVVTSMSGQTIEVINTDAEGRLVLCDALTWVQLTYKPKTVIDLATLTGAMIITLAHEYAGMFSNDETLANELLAAGQESGDVLWRLPLGPAYDKMIDSPIADMKNIGGKGGGSITAAQFLKRYIEDGVRWAHLDIAGTVWVDKPGTLHGKGATGFGVRLLDRLVAANFEG